jgi:hypothetical protein
VTTTRIGSLENILSELQSLAKKQPLKGDDLQRAKELMAMLKKSGYTNKQVSELSGDAWSQHTIKLYTRGVTTTTTIPGDEFQTSQPQPSIWERGAADARTILYYLSKDKNTLEVIRNGQPGSTSTTYQINPPLD